MFNSKVRGAILFEPSALCGAESKALWMEACAQCGWKPLPFTSRKARGKLQSGFNHFANDSIPTFALCLNQVHSVVKFGEGGSGEEHFHLWEFCF